MILVINIDATEEHRYRLTPIICHLFYIYIFILLKHNHQKGHSTVAEHDDDITPLLRWVPRLGLTLGPALGKASTIVHGRW